MLGPTQAGQGQLDRGVGAIVGLEEIDVFGQITAQLGADQGDGKEFAAALHAVLFSITHKKGRDCPALLLPAQNDCQAWPSARKNQVSSTESGFSDTLSMPCSISQRARSGWSDGP
ncbi:hypothetical protein D3C80_1741780 [compost metagenome]